MEIFCFIYYRTGDGFELEAIIGVIPDNNDAGV